MRYTIQKLANCFGVKAYNVYDTHENRVICHCNDSLLDAKEITLAMNIRDKWQPLSIEEERSLRNDY